MGLIDDIDDYNPTTIIYINTYVSTSILVAPKYSLVAGINPYMTANQISLLQSI